jgi:sugar diacid utilization regulator
LLTVEHPHPATAFEDVWLWATLADAEERLRELLTSGAEVAAKHPHLAQAVAAFGEHGFSVSEAARQLEVPANTVGYRLERWSGLTGWDPRTFDGLVRSLAAIRLR